MRPPPAQPSTTLKGSDPLRVVKGSDPAACRPLSAAMSAVSAPCKRLPAANTPGREVRREASTAGPSVPGSSSRPPITASSLSGTQSAVKTTVSQATLRVRPLSSSVNSTSSTRGRPWIALTAVRVQSGVRQRSAAPARNSASDWCLGNSVTIPTVLAPPWRSVRSAEKLTCSAPTTSARRPTRRSFRYTSCCSVPVVSTPSGREPGTSRAERGRSRQPVARITASGSSVSRPRGPVSSSGPSGDQPVTIVSVRSSAPAPAASCA